MKSEVISSIKECMNTSTIRINGVYYKRDNKDYIKLLRKNSKFKPISIPRHNKRWKSARFKRKGKGGLLIARQTRYYHIQISMDEHTQLVSYIKSRIKPKSYKDEYRKPICL